MLSVSCSEIISYLDDLLSANTFVDYAPNGLQIEGKPKIQRLCTAVSASLEVIEKARAFSADALLVHHGYFWKNEPPCLLGMKKNRIATLLKTGMNLMAYHLPLDCHPLLGNNALMAKQLAVEEVIAHTVRQTPHLLWSGTITKPLSFKGFLSVLKQKYGDNIQAVQAETVSSIQRVAWCTGAAQDLIEEAAKLQVDAYLSGEVSERTYYQAKELGLHYFACGHHATEREAVHLLGNHLAEHFGLKHQYIEVENPF